MRLPDAASAERLLPRVLGATVVAFTCGSSAVQPLLILGRLLRWPLLLVLAFLAVRWAAARVPRPQLPRVLIACAAALVGLALVSEGWTIRPILTGGRSVSLGILFVTAGALAIGAAGRPDQVRRLLGGILAGAIVVAAVGVLLLPVDYADAVQSATPAYAARYRGLGENPNTASLLLGVTLPIALWHLARATAARDRLLLGGVGALFLGSIVASGSRGALVGGLVGSLVFVLVAVRGRLRRAALATGAAAIAVLGLLVMQIPDPIASTGTSAPRPTRDAQKVLPLDAEIGRGPLDRPPPRIRRSAFGTSGRGQAWEGALRQAGERPLLGYGFGTEGSVFVDRYFRFYASSPENTYIGAFLQLGALGVAVFLALLLSLLALIARTLWVVPLEQRSILGAAAAVFVAALAVAVTQSYLLSVGNLAAVAVWVCAFLAASATSGSTASGR